jgi:uncharacterized peroxidase-related enzyme
VIRLKVIRHGRGLRARVMGLLLPLASGGTATGFVKVLIFRPRFFGAPIGRYGEAVLGGPGLWAIGERELFGAAVSAANACGYCTGVHAQIATDCLDQATVNALVHDKGEAPAHLRPAVAPMVAFLRRLSHDPTRLTAADVETLREAGISDEAIREATHAAALLEICNRVNTALGVEAMTPEGNRRAATMLLRRGYDL